MLELQTTSRGGGKRVLTEAQVAMRAAGLDVDTVAKRMRLARRTIEIYMRNGCDCLHTAERLAEILGCRVEAFRERRWAQGRKPAKRATERPSNQSQVRCKHLRLVRFD